MGTNGLALSRDKWHYGIGTNVTGYRDSEKFNHASASSLLHRTILIF